MLIERHFDGITLRERPGIGPTLLCLHGIGSAARSFDPLLPHLPADWHVVCWNAPGYAGSAPLSVDWPSAADYADRLHSLVEHLELAQFALLGHSLGVLMAARFAVRHPEKLTRLLLLSCALGHGAPNTGPLSDAAASRLQDLATLGPEAFATKRAPGLVHEPDQHPDIVQQVYQTMRAVDPAAYAQATRLLSSGRLLADVAQLTVPTQIAVGANDTITPPVANEAVYRAIPEPQRRGFAILPACGHALYQQQPASCAALLLAGGDHA